MTKTADERIAALEEALKQKAKDMDKLWDTVNILNHRIEQLRTAVPHVQFKEW